MKLSLPNIYTIGKLDGLTVNKQSLCISGYLFNVGKAATAAATEQVVKTAKQMKETVEEKVCLLTGTSTVQVYSPKSDRSDSRQFC